MKIYNFPTDIALKMESLENYVSGDRALEYVRFRRCTS